MKTLNETLKDSRENELFATMLTTTALVGLYLILGSTYGWAGGKTQKPMVEAPRYDVRVVSLPMDQYLIAKSGIDKATNAEKAADQARAIADARAAYAVRVSEAETAVATAKTAEEKAAALRNRARYPSQNLANDRAVEAEKAAVGAKRLADETARIVAQELESQRAAVKAAEDLNKRLTGISTAECARCEKMRLDKEEELIRKIRELPVATHSIGEGQAVQFAGRVGLSSTTVHPVKVAPLRDQSSLDQANKTVRIGEQANTPRVIPNQPAVHLHGREAVVEARKLFLELRKAKAQHNIYRINRLTEKLNLMKEQLKEQTKGQGKWAYSFH